MEVGACGGGDGGDRAASKAGSRGAAATDAATPTPPPTPTPTPTPMPPNQLHIHNNPQTSTIAHHQNNSEARNKQEKRTPYSRHYALKGRGRKEQLRFENKGDRTELVPTRSSVGV